MSLSIPITSKPCAAKKTAASDPTSPDAPVTTAMATLDSQTRAALARGLCTRRRRGSRRSNDVLERRAICLQPSEHIVEHVVDTARGRPSGSGRDGGVVRDVVRNVELARLRDAAHRDRPSRAPPALLGQLDERQAV